ncbi:right-handed parallel beta-helix repeat-containing protein [Pseudonocardia acaciae]|uniref:right-handed parallel beta-helix repeat-containing protein n=1 Tax=Pseudonocardia acaciae TaxID=551276 RepID=UPI0006877111|nr:right-handed parallel beta-helix repeat-containing protein [Pseudonocardia acaciae]
MITTSARARTRWLAAGAVLVAVVLLAGCGRSGSDHSSRRSSEPRPSESTAAAPAPAPVPAPAPAGTPGMGTPQPATNCTVQAGDPAAMAAATSGANPGDRICLAGDMGGQRLELRRSGTPERPIVVLGGGRATTKGITVDASNVVIDGVIARQPSAPGWSLKGTNITVSNSASLSPRGDDGDGIRFWGNGIKIVHNTIRDTKNLNHAHADCMQTFATDDDNPASQNVLIDGNRCEDIANMCLIAEGPDSEAGDGSGEGKSTNFVFTNNFCDNHASQALFADDVSNITASGNQIVGKLDKAFAFQNNSTGAKVGANRVERAGYEVGIDDSSQSGYQGPQPGGGP